jgi:S-DNA-T family DNA segregation ATPase FtsK/SpoIIIE
MTKRRSSRRSKKKGLRFPKIDLDQALDILGYVLLTLAGLTLLSFLSANQGIIPGWWLAILRQGFGWGAYLTPLLVGGGGLWLVLREFGDRLPKLTPLQIVGLSVGYLTLLTSMHLVSAIASYDGDLFVTAQAGDGGGYAGAFLVRTLLLGVGRVGTFILVITLWLVSIAAIFGITIQDVAGWVERVLQKVRRRSTVVGRTVSPAGPPQTAEQDAESRPPEEPDPEPTSTVEPPMPTGSDPETVPSAGPTASELGSELHVIGDEQSWELPILEDILEPGVDQGVDESVLREQSRIIESTLESLGAPVRVMEINRGPVVTQFGVEPLMTKGGKGKRVKVSRINALSHDLALALEAKTLRVEAPIPGKGLVGIEVPNPESTVVTLRDVMESDAFAALHSPLGMCLGQDVSGRPVVADLTGMPHLLIAGTTGSGKSVCINAIIAALLLQKKPAELRFVMVDPKRVELTGYNGVPHLISRVVVEMERVTSALKWVLEEMDGRYRRLSDVRATNIEDYNIRVAPQLDRPRLPYLVVIIDELADMMMMAAQETERLICRIAQMSRATGIHLIVATQRPSVNVVTGLIKANFPARIAFNVASAVDSRVIIDMPGAEQLLGQGDMLFLPPDVPMPMRLQGAYVSNEELRRLVRFWKKQGKGVPAQKPVEKPVQPPLWEELKQAEEKRARTFEDELLPDVIELVIHENRASISLLQRKLRIGYTRAARLMDILEENRVVGEQPSGGQARDVYPKAGRALLEQE